MQDSAERSRTVERSLRPLQDLDAIDVDEPQGSGASNVIRALSNCTATVDWLGPMNGLSATPRMNARLRPGPGW